MTKAKAKTTTLICEYCKKEFVLLESQVRSREKRLGHKIRFCSQKCMGESNKKAKIVTCLNCGKEFETTRNKFCCANCAKEYFKKNGVRKRNGYWYENGYKVLYLDGNKSIKEHIKVMEEYIGRKLEQNEVVHHIDFNRLNNDISNLKLMTRGEHSSLHRKIERENNKIFFKKAN